MRMRRFVVVDCTGFEAIRPVLMDTFEVGGGEMAEAADEPLVVDKVISSPRAST